MYRFILIAILTLCSTGLLGASSCESPDSRQAAQTEQIMNEVNSRLGLPGITNYTEKRFSKLIFELRDHEVSTWSYYMDMHGKLHFLCKSIGYGLPYSTQYTNPERRVGNTNGGVTLPQPDPNGLFMPDGVAATWIACANPDGGAPSVVYWEPDLIVAPFPLVAASNLAE